MPLELDNEIALVRLAQSGTIEVFGILVSRYERQIYRLVRAITMNDEDAEDLLEATFLRAQENLGEFAGEEPFYTWLARTAVNSALIKLRQRHAFTWESLDGHADGAEPMSTPRNVQEWHDDPRCSYSEAELNDILSRALEDLETPLRVIFVLSDMEGFSLEEISNVLGLSVPITKTYRFRALLKLRDNLGIWFENASVCASKSNGHNNGHHSRGPRLMDLRSP